MSKTSYIPQDLRNQVAKRDRGICFYCQAKATKAVINPRGVLVFYDANGVVFHIDHRIPRLQGGEDNLDNLVLACADCNLSRRKKKAANDPQVQTILKEINA